LTNLGLVSDAFTENFAAKTLPKSARVRAKAPQARDAGRSQVNLNTNALHEVYLEVSRWDNR
jgi:hypothetical protein